MCSYALKPNDNVSLHSCHVLLKKSSSIFLNLSSFDDTSLEITLLAGQIVEKSDDKA